MQWELVLLDALGYTLDLSRCAVTGETKDLRYVSPKSGRAVSVQGAGDWADRLLPLSDALRGEGAQSDADILKALATTGYFLEHKLAAAQIGKPLPEARTRFLTALERRAAQSP